ncbi:hypothetical protein [Sphingomonas sp. CCH5-D11]|uniref:hypothetical protein n=1 Tax=Sphingomonas sp. CCH5-D11 TaxID=1768786 RepID=UPI0008375BE6|nr:hypothetical protein [Sphingomonas sp. CCH5-D11]
MAAAIAFVLAQAVAPVCAGVIGEAVAITSRPLALSELGGRHEVTRGWSPPGDPRVGKLRYDWGLMLQSDDPRFTDFDLSPGSVHSRSSSCWFGWDSDYAGGKVRRILGGRIAPSGYRAGYVPAKPEATPTIPGFQFVAGTQIRDDQWIGLWNAAGDTERSQIVTFGGGLEVLATLPLRLGAIASLPDLHSNAQHLTIMGEGRVGRETAWMRLIWSGEPADR